MFTFPVTLYSGVVSGAPAIVWGTLSALSVAENAANGASVGAATATGGTSPRSYSIVAGNSAGVFAINSTTGAITIASNTNLNYEATTSYSLTIRATDSTTPTAQTADATQVINVTNITELPTNSAVPVISGTAQVGQVLSATTGTWASAAGSLSYAYQWKRAGVAISGATASSYTLVTADLANTITVTVSATNSDGSASATSAATASVAAAGIVWGTLSALSVAENAANGASVGTATATGGTSPRSYSIVAGNSAGVFAINSTTGAITIASNTNLNYEATTSYSLTIRATDSTTPTAQTADATQVINVSNITELPTNSAIPVITGTAQVGQVLSATTGTWASAAGSLSYAYQWKRAGVAISGATASSYTLVTADLANTITVTVSATNSDGSASATSAATASVAAASSLPTSSISFSGITQYLQMADTDFGSFDHQKFGVAMSIKPVSVSVSVQYLFYKNAPAEKFIGLYSNNLRFVVRVGTTNYEIKANSGSISAGVFNACYLFCDTTQATSTDRLQMWVNGSRITSFVTATYPALNATTNTDTAPVAIGASSSGTQDYEGLIYQPTFFSGTLPATTDVFDGTAGKLKDLSALTGAYSVLDVAGGVVTHDAKLATAWTNNGGVTSSTTIP